MLAFIILLIIGFTVSSFMYGYFAKNAIVEPTQKQQGEAVIIGQKTKSTIKVA
ncbi:MAG: hypothetical protein MUE81_09300 [Thermoflexibacter sp.]|jgi:hypothetical protein|nr:hypothetical protein [Thermoflexibacter sp.]